MTESINSGCPIGQEPGGRRFGVARHTLVEQAAQDLLDYPDAISGIRDKLRNNLQTYFGVMATHQPDKADYFVTKYERVAVHGAFFHLVGDEFIGSALPKIKDGESLIPEDLPASPDYYVSANMPNALAEQYHTFFGASLYRSIEAFNVFSEQVEQTQHHIYQPLITQSLSLHTQYREQAHVHDPQRIIDADWTTYNYDLAVDNTNGVMNLLIARQLACPNNLRADELTHRAIGDADTLSWQASTNRNVSAQYFQSRSSTMENDSFTDLRSALDEFGERVVFRHGSLKNGPWKEPRSCHGRLPLRTPDPENRKVAMEFFDMAEAQAGHPIQVPNDGTYDTVKASLIVGAHIARHTIFEQRLP